MHKAYSHYYKTQAATGLVGYQGIYRQRGHGFFGRILSKAVFPLLRFLGAKAAGVGANIATDVLLNNKNWKESAQDRLKEGGKEIFDAGIERGKKFIVEGKGRKRKRSTKPIKSKRLKLFD